jgi:hypothetical protein
MIKEILYVNMSSQFIYHTRGCLILQNTSEFNNVILQEKKKIADREYILNRFEPWEVDNYKSLRMLLISRSKNSDEKNLVDRYIGHLQAGDR